MKDNSTTKQAPTTSNVQDASSGVQGRLRRLRNRRKLQHTAIVALATCGLYTLSQLEERPSGGTSNQSDLIGTSLRTLDAAPKKLTSYGPTIPMGAGELRTFFTEGQNGAPKSIGVVFSASALDSLPSAPSDGRWDIVDAAGNIVMPCCGHEHALELPHAALAATPFEHVVINWNPHGHQPPGVYDLPHFDFHFYTITEAERVSIALPAAEERCELAPGEFAPVTCDIFNRAMQPLSAAQMPADYFSVGAVEPGMGNHMLYALAPELAGEPFTHTWIFGTWDGAISFFEPMITRAYLQSLHGKRCFDYPMPEAFTEAGYYPTRYCISQQPATARCGGPPGRGGVEREYRVALDRFVFVPKE